MSLSVVGQDGYNPMNYDCKGGERCFNKFKRPKIELFHHCYHGNISEGDIDSIVEIHGQFHITEWKPAGGFVPLGQELLFDALDRLGVFTIVVVAGNPYTMKIWGYYVHKAEGPNIMEPHTFADLWYFKQRWAEMARLRRRDRAAA